MDDARTTILTNVDLIVEEIAEVHFLRNQGNYVANSICSAIYPKV